MELGALIQNHGYWVLAAGCLLEGESILILAGFAVHRGYLNPVAVFAIASTAGFLGDQFFFSLGRRHGQDVLRKWPSIALQNERLQNLLARYHTAVIVGVRFAYGLRIAGPILIGMSPVSAYRFGTLNALGAMLWAGLIGGIGWGFGQTAETILGEIRHLEGRLILGLASLLLLIWLIKRWSRRSRHP